MMKLTVSAAAIVLSASATVAMAQSTSSEESRQMAAPNASNDSVRAAVMATSQTKPVHAQKKATTKQGESLSAVNTSSGAESGAWAMEVVETILPPQRRAN
jgi:hypothetical protein